MIINEIRIYAEVLEQGLDFKTYLEDILKDKNIDAHIKNIYTKKCRDKVFSCSDSLMDRIRKVKDIDVLISVLNDNKEYPLVIIEYSTAVPTDDHRMQRSDVYFWGAKLRVPVLKISPRNKHMDMDFGGGDKLSNLDEEFITFNAGGLLKIVDWETDENGSLITKPNCLSCIDTNTEIKAYLCSILEQYKKADTFSSVFCALRKDPTYQPKSEITIDKIKEQFPNSSRFKYQDTTGDLTIKINRFGHAMDPDRGVIFFQNMLHGPDKLITEIQMERDSISGRGGYNSLFDALSNKEELLNYVRSLPTNRSMKGRDAFILFINALNLSKLFGNITNYNGNEYYIEDGKLKNFLNSNEYGNSCKFIFWLSKRIVLTDLNRQVIFTINWTQSVANDYIAQCSNNVNYIPKAIKVITNKELNEDLITYSSVELYKKLKCELLAVSYPGAQGDRCLLEEGNGKKNKRIYIDIIASKDSSVFLEEAKDKISKSKQDIDKLYDIVSNRKSEKFKRLCNFLAIYKPNILPDFEVKISIAGAKPKQSIPLDRKLDYIILFWINNNDQTIEVRYEIYVCNIKLIQFFKPLAVDDCLSGILKLAHIYVMQ